MRLDRCDHKDVYRAIGGPIRCQGCFQVIWDDGQMYHEGDVYPLKKDEVRITSATGGQKGQKACRLGAVDPVALRELGLVAGMGEEKYDRFNYLKGYAWSLNVDAAFRHLLAFLSGEDRDPESGYLHTAHAMWHMGALTSFQLRNIGTDDRAPFETTSIYDDDWGQDEPDNEWQEDTEPCDCWGCAPEGDGFHDDVVSYTWIPEPFTTTITYNDSAPLHNYEDWEPDPTVTYPSVLDVQTALNEGKITFDEAMLLIGCDASDFVWRPESLRDKVMREFG